MKINTGILSLLGAFLLTAAALPAATIIETEVNGAASNNSLATAQAILWTAFTSPAPANVSPAHPTVTIQGKGGFDDVDYYSFQNTVEGSLLFLDIDNSPSTFDTLIAVFNSAGTLIAYGDDTNPPDPGSAGNVDSRLAPLVLSQLGTYYIAVAEFSNLPSAALFGTETPLSLGGLLVSGATPGLSTFDFNGNQPAASLGYTLQASVLTPEPGTFGLVGLALAAVGVQFARRKQ